MNAKQLKEQEAEEAEVRFAKECAAYNATKRKASNEK